MRRVAIVCHRNADVDAYLSAYALARLLKKLSPHASIVIVSPDGMTALAEKMRNFFTHVVVRESTEDYDLFVVVDVGHTTLLKSWLQKMRESRGMKVLIDHHPFQDEDVYDRKIVDPKATSAGEVVYRVYRDLRVSVDRKTAQALLTAILFDSQHLAIVGKRGLKATLELVERGADLKLARKMLRSPPDYGEVIAKLKGAQRVSIFKSGPWILVASRVGSFQAHVARALVHMGADVAVVSGDSNGETRTSLRSTARFFDETGVHLGTQVAEAVSKQLGGFGGGHPTAASFVSKEGEEKDNNECLNDLSGLLKGEATEVR
jgi:nanoRNase/pAp phosphatase (c-di-AMP/oligoRNAs hydrolase)